MQDKMFGLYDKCPKCGKGKGLYYLIQYPLEVCKTMDGKTFIKVNEKKTTRISQKRKAIIFERAQVDFQVAQCVCSICDWVSDPITQ